TVRSPPAWRPSPRRRVPTRDGAPPRNRRGGRRSLGPCRGWPWRGRPSRTRRRRCRQHLGLAVEDLGDPVLGQTQEVVELTPAERLALGRSLHLDEAPGG